MKRYSGSFSPKLVALALGALLAGCASTAWREQAQSAMAGGAYEQAVQSLEASLKTQPGNIELRAALLRMRSEALARLLAKAAELVTASQLDEAQALLARALQLDPGNARALSLQAEMATHRLQQQALDEASGWVGKQRPDVALRSIESALKGNPHHAGLLQLQRKLELDQRQAQMRAGVAVLAEMRPISLDFRDANLRTVLDVVTRNSGTNFILDRDIRSDLRVTLLLRETKVEDALDLLIGTHQLAKKVVDANTIVVYPNTPEKQREYQEQLVRVFYLASAEARGAASFLRAMLKIRDPFVDERSNMLALRESQENIQLAERLIALYDNNEPEVLLEVEVLEMSANRLSELGVKFPSSLSLTPLAPAGAGAGLTRDRVGVGVGGLLLNLRREVGDFTTLANPRIRARNKEKARILIGDKIPIVSTTTGSAGFVSDTITYLDVGLKLEVEPTVYADDEVGIRIGLEVSSLGSAVKTASGALAYQIGTRNANTVLRLRDGETQLLAGLINREERHSASRLPGVGDMPVVGRLFSSQLDNEQRTELVLAITPRVLRNIRRAHASETELWVGTDAQPRLRPPGVGGALAGRGVGARGLTRAPVATALPGDATLPTATSAPVTRMQSGMPMGTPELPAAASQSTSGAAP